MATALLILSAILSGCRKGAEATGAVGTTKVAQPVRKSASDPHLIDDFREIIDKDLFCDATCSKDKLLKAVYPSEYDERMIIERGECIMMDKYGEELLSFSCKPIMDEWGVSSYSDFRISAIIVIRDVPIPLLRSFLATDDGGILYLYGWGDNNIENINFMNNYRIVKCDSEGNVKFEHWLQFDRLCEIKSCFEKDGEYYLFGTILREDKTLSDPETDGYAVTLDFRGNIIKSERINCGDSSRLVLAEPGEDGFFLLLDPASSDEDLSCFIDCELNVSEMKEAKGKPGAYIGTKAGQPVYRDDPLLKDYVEDEPVLFVDYGDFYLVRSMKLLTGDSVYSDEWILRSSTVSPAFDKDYQLYEITYSAYDVSGNLLFREKCPDFVTETVKKVILRRLSRSSSQ